MNPSELLAAALNFASHPNRRLGGTRFLAAALLLRQALEDALDGFWKVAAPGMEQVSGRARLVSLPFYVENQALAGDVTYAWYRLSATLHHDA